MDSTHQGAHTRHESEGEREFSFWSSPNTISSENGCDQHGGNEARLNNEAEFVETYQRKAFKFERYSPLCSTVSDPSRRKAIAEGQRELMEMVQSMPESSYELSFQDMVVVDKHALEPESCQNETSLDNTPMQSGSDSEAKLKGKNKKKKNKSNSRPGQILRVQSMDTETFLLKMFFPTSFDWMKKGKTQNGSSKVSPRPSFQESIKHVGKEWRIRRFFLAGHNRGDPEEGISQNNGGDNNSNKNRYIDHSLSFSHGCWPFAPYAKGKTKQLGG